MKAVRNLLLVTAMLIPILARAETLVTKKRLGNNTEGMTYKSNGVNADRAVAIDGNDVISIALSGTGHTTLFNVLGLDPLARTPRGIVWDPTNLRFYFSSKSPAGASELFVSDENGFAQATLELTGLADTADWVAWEGLAYVPTNAPAFAGAIVGFGFRNTDSGSHLFYVDPETGAVLAEIVPQPGTPVEQYLCGISYWPQHPGSLLVTDCGGSNVFQVDMVSGLFLGSIAQLPEAGDVEGVVVRSNGQIYLNGYETGHLYAYDAFFNRTPGFDREFLVGLGISVARLGWNSDTGELLATTPGSRHVYALARNLKTARFLFTANDEISDEAGLAFLGGNRVAIGTNGANPGIDIVDMATGNSLSRIVMSGIGVRGVGLNGTSTWLLGTRNRSEWRVFTRAATPDASVFPDGAIPVELDPITLALPSTGRDVQLFDSGQGLRVFTGAEMFDLDGNLIHSIDAATLGVTDSIAGGVWLGGKTFAIVDGQTSTVVVFTVP